MLQLHVLRGDITHLHVDAIVNAANSSLLGGGGVDGAIHRAGGPAILEACRAIRARQGSLAPGGAVITTAGQLPARHVIHTVGPVWRGGDVGERATLASCYTLALKLAEANGCRTVAFPNVSTGVYGFPKGPAAEVAVAAVRAVSDELSVVEEVTFVCFDAESYALYAALLADGV